MTTRQKTVLGISAYFHDSAATLVQGGNIIAAVQEERFTRKKADWRFPQNAIKYCLSKIPANTELDAVAYYEDPSQKVDRIIRNAISVAPRGTISWNQTLRTLNTLNTILPARLVEILPDPERIYFSPHHRSHAASAFYPSPFCESAILVTDGVGEWATSSIWHGSEAGLSLVKETHFPDSIGMLYSAFTQYCGFKVNSGEYKLMGLAPFGRPLFEKAIYRHLIDVLDNGEFHLNMDYFDFDAGTSTISPLFHSLFTYPPRKPKEPISMHYMNVAASIQKVLNDIMIRRASTALQLTESKNLCMAGGVALNCVANSEIALRTKGLEKIWVQPAAGDAGGALGAAMDISQQLDGIPEKPFGNDEDGMKFSYLGPSFTTDDIENAINQYGLAYENHIDDENEFVGIVAQALLEGQIIGYFDGSMEFGPRALGNRSILADPRALDMLQKTNKKIKFRETWRPLAPIVLAEHENQLFDFQNSDPYMLFVAKLKEEYRTKPSLSALRSKGFSELQQYLKHPTSEFPGVVHYDYSARTQSLSKEANPRLYQILTEFYNFTGCPMLLNTSFNVRGEPIVCSPKDAIVAFMNTNLDMLAIGSFVIKRNAQTPTINSKIGKRQFDED